MIKNLKLIVYVLEVLNHLKKLSSKFGIPKSYTDLKMLNDNEFDALIIAINREYL